MACYRHFTVQAGHPFALTVPTVTKFALCIHHSHRWAGRGWGGGGILENDGTGLCEECVKRLINLTQERFDCDTGNINGIIWTEEEEEEEEEEQEEEHERMEGEAGPATPPLKKAKKTHSETVIM